MLDNAKDIIQRWISEDIRKHMYRGKAIVILGPRQCGKTTLLNQLYEADQKMLYLNCDDVKDKQALEEKSISALKSLVRMNKLVLIDEILTPDSSRFWPADQYKPGISPPSFDKQFVRDYLETLDWGKVAPGPELPADIIDKTAAKYREVADLITK